VVGTSLGSECGVPNNTPEAFLIDAFGAAIWGYFKIHIEAKTLPESGSKRIAYMSLITTLKISNVFVYAFSTRITQIKRILTDFLYFRD
jgi:hypothetical protein